MRFVEFATQEAPVVAEIVALSDQLKNDLDKGKINTPWSVDQLIEYFRQNSKGSVNLDRTNLYNMIKKDPLKNLISNIQGDDVIWKGMPGKQPTKAPPPEQSKDVVKKMAQHALKK